MAELNFCGASKSLVLIGTSAPLRDFRAGHQVHNKCQKVPVSAKGLDVILSLPPQKPTKSELHPGATQCDISNGHLFVQNPLALSCL